MDSGKSKENGRGPEVVKKRDRLTKADIEVLARDEEKKCPS
jgi:hypothetical protein